MLSGLLSLYGGVIVLALVTVPVALIVDKAIEFDGWQRTVVSYACFVAAILVGSALYSGIRTSFSESTVWGFAQLTATALLFYAALKWFGRSGRGRDV